MCGIVGLAQYQSELPKEVRNKVIRMLFSDIMLQTLVRGRHATGIYQVQKNGDWMMAKQGIPVNEWLVKDKDDNNPVVYKHFTQTWDEHHADLSAIVGHCRAATVGSKGQDNKDNHPFAIQVDRNSAILMVHNGTLDNHEKIFENLPDVLDRQGKVDSEALAHFLFYLSQHGKEPFIGEMFRHLAARVQGSYAIAAMNTKFPNRVALLRKERPLEMYLIKPLNILLIASEKKFVDDALKRYAFHQKIVDPSLPVLEHTDRMLLERSFRIFDTSMPFPSDNLKDYQIWDQLTVEHGDICKHHDKLEDAWRSPTKITTSGSSAYSNPYSNMAGYSGTGGAVSNPPKVSKHSAANPGRHVPRIPPRTGDKTKVVGKSSGINVEAEIHTGAGDKTIEVNIHPEEEEAFAHAQSLSLSITYETDHQIAEVCRKTESQMKTMAIKDVANEVAKTNFALGYALAKTDSASEVEKVRSGSRKMHKSLEHLTQKRTKAERRIWEFKAIIQMLLALHGGEFKKNLPNLERSIRAFDHVDPDRQKDVLQTAWSIFHSKETRRVVQELRKRHKSAQMKERQHQNSEEENV